jgi:ribonuclease P protein component
VSDPTGVAGGVGFSRRLRITDSVDFTRTFDAGSGRRGRYVVVWLRPSAMTWWRLGVVASKRTFRRAVDRARAKRLIREAFRHSAPGLRGGMDAVVVARRAILGAGMQQVKADWERVIAGAGGA